MQYDTKHISFLDIEIFIQENRTIGTTVFHKLTAGNTILHVASAHLCPLVISIPYSQYLRLRRICSSEDHFKQEADALGERLLPRGYSLTTLKKAFNKAYRQSRQEVLFKKRDKTGSGTVRLLTSYNRHHSYISTDIC